MSAKRSADGAAGANAIVNRGAGTAVGIVVSAGGTTAAVGGIAVRPALRVAWLDSWKKRRRCRAVEVEATKVTWKLDAPALSVSADVTASVWRRPTMLMAALCDPAASMGPDLPLIVALAPVMVVVPKFASGKTPKSDEGASTIHSAEDRWAPALVRATEKD